jgi:hypothetical protein
MSQSTYKAPDTGENVSQVLAVDDRENGRLSEGQLTATNNPALARLAGAVRGQSVGNSAESYSRMHNRHNRS